MERYVRERLSGGEVPYALAYLRDCLQDLPQVLDLLVEEPTA
ncbi:MAG: hypothetical protein KatS3mg115_2227 [Candidatus Poribacteria bacterium]|nr:MAG: hypothetical protein KatS3mg115_2227 [Candidatus Poribacteria bacterium]